MSPCLNSRTVSAVRPEGRRFFTVRGSDNTVASAPSVPASVAVMVSVITVLPAAGIVSLPSAVTDSWFVPESGFFISQVTDAPFPLWTDS